MTQQACNFNIIISKSFARSLWILFKPFSIKKWLILLFIAWLAGALGSGGNFNLGNFDTTDKAEAYPVREVNIYEKEGASLSHSIDELPEFSGESLQEAPINEETFLSVEEQRKQPEQEAERSFCPTPKGIALTAIGAAVVALPLLLLFAWLCSRFKFIWYEAIVKNDSLIVEPFKNYKKEGNSLCLFFIAYGILWWICFCGLGVWSYFSAKGLGAFESDFTWSFLVFFKLFGWQIFILIGMIIFGLLSLFLVDHFIVPIMAMDQVLFSQGFTKFMDLYKSNQRDIWLFLLISFGLSILCGVISVIVVIMLILILSLLALILFGMSYLLCAVLLKMKVLFAIFAVVVGIPFIVITILLLTATALPFAIFFRHLSLYFLSSLDCDYVPLPVEDYKNS